MSEKWHGGKGDRVRKSSNQKKYRDNWEIIFGKKPKSSKYDNRNNKNSS